MRTGEMRGLRHHPGFRLLFVGLALSMLGDSAMLLLLGIWVKDLTGSNAAAGSAFLVFALPSLLSPVGGYVVDRVRRRPFLVWANVGSAAVVLPLLLVRGRDQLWIIYAVSFGYGLSFVVVGAALNGLLKALLPDESLAAANAAVRTVKEGLRLVGPVSGAGLYAAVGPAPVIVFDAVSFLAAAGCLLLLKVAEPRPQPAEHHWTSEMAAGVRYLLSVPVLRRVVLACAAALLVIGFAESVIFAVVDQGLHRPASFLGVLICVQGVGAVIGGATAAAGIRRVGEQVTVGLGLLLFGIGALALTAGALPLAFAGLVVAGTGLAWAVVAALTLLQRGTPSPLIGRVSAAADALIGTSQVVSVGLGALLVALVDYRLLLLAIAVVVVGCGGYLLHSRTAPAPVAVRVRSVAPVGARALP